MPHARCFACKLKMKKERDADKALHRKLANLFSKKIVVTWESLPEELKKQILIT